MIKPTTKVYRKQIIEGYSIPAFIKMEVISFQTWMYMKTVELNAGTLKILNILRMT